MTSKLRELAEGLIKANTNDRLSKAKRVEVLELLRQSKRNEIGAVAVIVNDMSVVNVDARLMKNGSAPLSRVDERLVEMQNG
jgi:CobW/HypB/UreG, nucleotide-binding domain